IHEVPNLILALDGKGEARYFADYSQWENFEEELEEEKAKVGVGATTNAAGAAGSASSSAGSRSGTLSTSEKKELLDITNRIEKAEELVRAIQKDMEDVSVATDHQKLLEIQKRMDDAQANVEKLYRRWEDLETRQNS